MNVSPDVAAQILDDTSVSKRTVKVAVVTDARTYREYDEASRLLTATANLLPKDDFRKELQLLVNRFKDTFDC